MVAGTALLAGPDSPPARAAPLSHHRRALLCSRSGQRHQRVLARPVPGNILAFLSGGDLGLAGRPGAGGGVDSGAPGGSHYAGLWPLHGARHPRPDGGPSPSLRAAHISVRGGRLQSDPAPVRPADSPVGSAVRGSRSLFPGALASGPRRRSGDRLHGCVGPCTVRPPENLGTTGQAWLPVAGSVGGVGRPGSADQGARAVYGGSCCPGGRIGLAGPEPAGQPS